MQHITESQLKAEIKAIISLLVEENYRAIQVQNILPYGNIFVLIERIQQYPGHITMPPDRAFDDLEFIEFEVTEDNFFFQAELNLWFDNQESDLTASFLPSTDQAKSLICLYDLHVL